MLVNKNDEKIKYYKNKEKVEMEKDIKYKDMIEIIYQAEEKTLDEKIKEVNQKVKNRINDINIDNILENTSRQGELRKVFEEIEENYSIKISEYNKEFYKQGFIDGVNLIINCIKT